MNDTAVFDAPWDQRLTTLTAVLSIVLLGVAALLVWVGLARIPIVPIRAIVVLNAIIPLAALAVCALLAPRGYEVRDGVLRVDRFIAPVEIPLGTVESIETLSPDKVAGARRTAGNGGLFGYYGRFTNQALGDFRMYATRNDGYVLVRARTPYVLTPRSPDRFIEAVNRVRSSVPRG